MSDPNSSLQLDLAHGRMHEARRMIGKNTDPHAFFALGDVRSPLVAALFAPEDERGFRARFLDLARGTAALNDAVGRLSHSNAWNEEPAFAELVGEARTVRDDAAALRADLEAAGLGRTGAGELIVSALDFLIDRTGRIVKDHRAKLPAKVQADETMVEAGRYASGIQAQIDRGGVGPIGASLSAELAEVGVLSLAFLANPTEKTRAGIAKVAASIDAIGSKIGAPFNAWVGTLSRLLADAVELSTPPAELARRAAAEATAAAVELNVAIEGDPACGGALFGAYRADLAEAIKRLDPKTGLEKSGLEDALATLARYAPIEPAGIRNGSAKVRQALSKVIGFLPTGA